MFATCSMMAAQVNVGNSDPFTTAAYFSRKDPLIGKIKPDFIIQFFDIASEYVNMFLGGWEVSGMSTPYGAFHAKIIFP